MFVHRPFTAHRIRISTAVIVLGLIPLGGREVRAGLFIPTDPSDVVVATSGDDFIAGNFSIGFDFRFFGSGGNTAAAISSNGNIQFGTYSTGYANNSLPTSYLRMIAPLWDDLYLPPGDIRYNNSNVGVFVVIYDGVSHYANRAALATAEAVLIGDGNPYGLPSGSVILSYGEISSGFSPTVGLNQGNDIGAATLSGIVGSADGVLSDSETQSLSGRTFVFLPDGDGYRVTEGVPTVLGPEPASLVSAGLAVAAALIRVRRGRRH